MDALAAARPRRLSTERSTAFRATFFEADTVSRGPGKPGMSTKERARCGWCKVAKRRAATCRSARRARWGRGNTVLSCQPGASLAAAACNGLLTTFRSGTCEKAVRLAALTGFWLVRSFHVGEPYLTFSQYSSRSHSRYTYTQVMHTFVCFWSSTTPHQIRYTRQTSLLGRAQTYGDDH